MRKGVNRNPSRRPGLAVSDSNLHAVKTGHSESAAFPGYTPLRSPSPNHVYTWSINIVYDYQFGVHLSHKITPLPPIENFSTVIGLSIVLSSCAATPPNSLRRAMALSGRLHSPPKSLTPDSQPV